MNKDYYLENSFEAVMFRHVIAAQVFGLKLDEPEDGHVLSPKLRNRLANRDSTDHAERLLFLFGIGALTENTLERLLFNFDECDISELVSNFERQAVKLFIDNNGKYCYDQNAYALLLAANSQRHTLMQKISFDNAMKLQNFPDVKINDDGFLQITAQPLVDFIIDNDIPIKFGTYSHYELSKCENPACDDENLIVLDVTDMLGYLSVYYSEHGQDYIKYAVRNGDQATIDGYNEYCTDLRYSYSFYVYKRKHSISVSSVNKVDYSNIKISGEGGEAITVELIPTENYLDRKPLIIDKSASNEVIREQMVARFFGEKPIEDKSIIKVVNAEREHIYICNNGVAELINPDDFYSDDKVDLQKLWTIIKQSQIKKENGRLHISIPTEHEALLSDEEKEYLQRLVKEQYAVLKAPSAIKQYSELLLAARQQYEDNEEKRRKKPSKDFCSR
ncbi:MAG: hypothetical protein LIO69_00180 [Oscillospiraceae bacterium]|nr:hypothetical protein [Oscillospiraceae bacterium]